MNASQRVSAPIRTDSPPPQYVREVARAVHLTRRQSPDAFASSHVHYVLVWTGFQRTIACRN